MENNPIIQEEPDQISDLEDRSLIQNPAADAPPLNNLKVELAKANKILVVSVVVVILTLILAFVIISLFPKPYSKLFVGLEKPAFDTRKYKAFELPNEIKVLLISDSESELAGVSIDVGVGSWNEPDNLPGLAHFLEHMLFMGSKKYPSVSEFNDFVSVNGGSYNAMTGSQNTNYFYSISANALEHSMDIFSRFFIDPLLNEETVEKEINAVNSEYTNDLTDPNWKLDIALEMITNKGHPASRFSIGNLKTLRDDPSKNDLDTYKELKKFHSKFYSSNLMTLVVSSKDSLTALEKMVRDKFTDIPNKNLDRRALNNYSEKAFDHRNQGLFVSYKSPNEQKTLDIVFSIDSELDDFKKKPLVYFCNLIENGSPSGFSVFLKDKGYITNIETILQSQNLNFTLFVIHLELTEKGYKNTKHLLNLVFSFLRKIQNQGISQERFLEFKQIFALNFYYKEKKNDLMEEVRDLSFALNTYPIENALNSDYIVEDYDESLYSKIISSFVPENSIIILGNKEFYHKTESSNNSSEDTNVSFFHERLLRNYSNVYKFAYNVRKLPDEIIANISTNLDDEMENVSLPNKNRFIPDTFKFMNSSSAENIFSSNLNFKGAKSNNNQEFTQKKNKNSDFDPTPEILAKNNKLILWHKTDDTFKLPLYVIHLSLDSPLTHTSARNSLFMSILIEYFNQEIQKNLYDAIYLGYKIDLQNNGRGLNIVVKGYNDKTDLALLEILKIFKGFSINSDKFEFLRSIVSKNLKNDYSQAAYLRGKDILKQILRKYYHSPNQLEKIVDNVKIEEFNEFFSSLKSQMRIEMLIYGNVGKEIAEKLSAKMNESLEFEAANADNLMKEQILNIKDHIYEFRDFNENAEDENNLLFNYYQYGPYEFNSSLQLAMINEKLSNEAFNYLRGELQLGYVASSAKINLYGICGIVVFVQGSVADPVQMDEKAEEFLKKFSDSFMKMSDEEFESMTASTMKIVIEGEKEIEERSSFVWDEIRSQFYEFGKRQKAISFLKNLQKNEFLRFYKSFIAQNIGKLSVQLFSQTKYKLLDNQTQNNSSEKFIHVNGTTNIVLSDWEAFANMERYDFQVGSKTLESFMNKTEIVQE